MLHMAMVLDRLPLKCTVLGTFRVVDFVARSMLSPALHHFKAFTAPTDTKFTEADRVSKTAVASS